MSLSSVTGVVTYSPSDADLQMSDVFNYRSTDDRLHPTVEKFLAMSTAEIVDFYMAANPTTDRQFLQDLIAGGAKHFRWTGVDLVPTTDGRGQRRMTLIESNSCPTGTQCQAFGSQYGFEGYRRVAAEGFVNWLKDQHQMVPGDLAVLIDMEKNKKECGGYAHFIAKATGEPVHLVNMKLGDNCRWSTDGILAVKTASGWRDIRAAFRKVVVVPWGKIPVTSRTRILNPIVACLAGGRNKELAQLAYEEFNRTARPHGLQIETPWSRVKLTKSEIAPIARQLNYKLVVKRPYSNSGLDVFVITCKEQLDELLAREFDYDVFMVQSLISHPDWIEPGQSDERNLFVRCCQVDGDDYFFDLRMMVVSGKSGWLPVVTFARRPPLPLLSRPPVDSDTLGHSIKTNMSRKQPDGVVKFEIDRMLPLGSLDFPGLNLTLADLVDAYLQAVMAGVALDRLCDKLVVEQTGEIRFDEEKFAQLSGDQHLVAEIRDGNRLITVSQP